MVRGVAQLGRAPALGAGSRRFESCRPDQRIGGRARFKAAVLKTARGKTLVSSNLTLSAIRSYGGSSSVVERLDVAQVVAGSIPVYRPKVGFPSGKGSDCKSEFRRFDSGSNLHWGVAKLVRHLTLVQVIEGSNPSSPTIEASSNGRTRGFGPRYGGSNPSASSNGSVVS